MFSATAMLVRGVVERARVACRRRRGRRRAAPRATRSKSAAQLDQRAARAAAPGHASAGRRPSSGSCVRGSSPSAPSHGAPRSRRACGRPAPASRRLGLVVEDLPAGVADRGELAKKMVHRGVLLQAADRQRAVAGAGWRGQGRRGPARRPGSAGRRGIGGRDEEQVAGHRGREVEDPVVVPGGLPTNMFAASARSPSGVRA